MDLRTIINSDNPVDAASRPPPAQHPPPPSPLQKSASGVDQDAVRLGSTNVRDEHTPGSHQVQHEYGARQSQPQPLQPHIHSPQRSSSYSSVQSPYQQPPHPPPPILSGPSVPQSRESLSDRPTGILPMPRDSFAVPSTLPQQAGTLSSPFTPQPLSATTQQSYFSQRSHSIHSAASPSSARSFSYPPPREPPSALQQQPSAPQQQQQPQSYSPSRQRSQPGTPLPAAGGPYSRPSPHPVRPPSSGHDNQSSAHIGSSWSSQDPSARDRRDATPSRLQTPVPRQDSTAIESIPRQYSLEREKEQYTDSVSPKAVASSHAGQISDSSAVPTHPTQTPHKETDVARQTTHATPTTMESTGLASNTGHTTPSSYLPTTPQTSRPPPPSSRPTTISPRANNELPKEISPTMAGTSQNTPSKPNSKPLKASEPMAYPPRKKRKRYSEPPIYAQKALRTSGAPPPIPNRKSFPSPLPPPKPTPTKDYVEEGQSTLKDNASAPKSSLPVKEGANGQANVNGDALKAPVTDQVISSLGPWEPSITGIIPHEEITKVICDFLFQQVVMRKDIGAGPAGGAAIGSGAILEVEAKLGQLVDKNRGERLRLPILTECVVSKDDPNIRLAFESSMSLAQHRVLNDFLNESVKTSIAQGTSRIPLSYAHKKERDTFYEVPSSSLPPIVQHHIHARHKPKVRVTTDQRTGAVLARIVKCRIADLEVYSPRTCLDWRISVNLEMNYEGDLSLLQPATDSWKRGKERNKDRMSYRHLAYQIDLTQVGSSADNAPPTPQPDCEHELEIEISSAEVRRQGDLALAGDPSNKYEELIKGFVDNVRVLARAVPPR